MFGDLFEFVDFVSKLFPRFLEGINCGLLRVGGVLGLGEFVLRFLHLTGCLADGLGGFRGNFGGVLLGFFSFAFYIFLFLRFRFQSFTFFGIHVSDVLSFLLGFSEGLLGILKLFLGLGIVRLGGSLGLLFGGPCFLCGFLQSLGGLGELGFHIGTGLFDLFFNLGEQLAGFFGHVLEHSGLDFGLGCHFGGLFGPSLGLAGGFVRGLGFFFLFDFS